MTEIHVLNYPIAVTNCVLSTSARLLTTGDLWSALFVAFNYSILYLLILDRLGVHLYPVFSPRSKFCVFAWSSVRARASARAKRARTLTPSLRSPLAQVFIIYYFTFTFWNAVMATGELDSLVNLPSVLKVGATTAIRAISIMFMSGKLSAA